MHQPGKSTWVSRLHSSWHQHCRTLHSSWGQRTMWQAGVWQRTHSHLQPPTRTENTSYCWPHQSNGNKQEQSQLQWSAIKVLQKTIFLIQSLYITNSGKMACTPATRDICADNTFNITLMTKLTKKSNVIWVFGLTNTWCARHMRSRSCLCKNLATTSDPNVKETPRSFSPQPMVSLSGSDHKRSHRRPWSGTSVGRMIRRICSMDCKSGLRPAEHRQSG